MNKGIFLDRDGVLNREKGSYITRVEDFELLPGVPEALSYLQDKGYHLIVVTNQGGIAKGLYTEEELQKMHDKMVLTLSAVGVNFSEIYYCPHYPDHGKCLCRKPGSLLVEKGIARFRLDREQCWFIGDRDRDVGAAQGAGVKGILVAPNLDLRDTVRDLGL